MRTIKAFGIGLLLLSGCSTFESYENEQQHYQKGFEKDLVEGLYQEETSDVVQLENITYTELVRLSIPQHLMTTARLFFEDGMNAYSFIYMPGDTFDTYTLQAQQMPTKTKAKEVLRNIYGFSSYRNDHEPLSRGEPVSYKMDKDHEPQLHLVKVMNSMENSGYSVKASVTYHGVPSNLRTPDRIPLEKLVD